MPILNIQFGEQGRRIDGTVFPLHPQSGLVQRGPIVQVTVSVRPQIAEQVLLSGGTLPVPISGIALIDTGATITCVDEIAAQQLHLPVIDVVNVASTSQTSA